MAGMTAFRGRASCQAEHFIERAVESDDARRLACFKMGANRVPDVGPDFLSRIRLRDAGLAEGTGNETAFGFVFADFKNELGHGFKLSRQGAPKEVRLAWSSIAAPLPNRRGTKRRAWLSG